MAIKIHYDLTYRVYLPSSALPQDFPLSSDTTTPEGALEQGQAIIRLLGALLDMDEPVCRLIGGGVNMGGEPNGYYITISQGTDPLARPTSPAVTTWGCNPESQGLWLNFDPKLTQELLGDYPIISMDQARDEILAGEWSADGTVPTEEDIYRSELVYCSDLGGLTMPYYCFYLYKGTFNGRHARDRMPICPGGRAAVFGPVLLLRSPGEYLNKRPPVRSGPGAFATFSILTQSTASTPGGPDGLRPSDWVPRIY